MPELTQEGLQKLNALFQSKGSSLLQQEKRLTDLFVLREADPEVKRRNRKMLDAALMIESANRGIAPEKQVPLSGATALATTPEAPLPPIQKPGTLVDPSLRQPGPVGATLTGAVQGIGDVLNPAIEFLMKAKPGPHLPPLSDEALAHLNPEQRTYLQHGGNPLRALMPRQEELGMAYLEQPKTTKVSRIGGNILPMLAIPGGAFATPTRAAVTGATMGFLTTEGDLKERGIGAAAGAASFGGAAKLKAITGPVVGALQERMLGYGLEPGVARIAAARFAPYAQAAILDSAAFTGVGAIEQEFRYRNQPEMKASIGEMFLTNLATIGAMQVAGAAMGGKPGEKFRRGREAVQLRRAFESEAGPGGMAAAKEASRGLHDQTLAALAYRAALKGTDLSKLPPEQIKAFLKGGPDALRAMAPEAAKDLFAKEQAAMAPPVPETNLIEPVATPEAVSAERLAAARPAAQELDDITRRLDYLREAADKRAAEIDMNMGDREAIKYARQVDPIIRTIYDEIGRLERRSADLEFEGDIEAKALEYADIQDYAGQIERVYSERDAIANVLPPDSVGAKRLTDGTAAEAAETVKRLAESGAMPPADLPIDVRDIAKPEAQETLRRSLAEIPPSTPGSAEALAAAEGRPFSKDVKVPHFWDYLRGTWRTFPKILGPELGQRFHEIFLKARWKTDWMMSLARRSMADTSRKYSAWLNTLDPLQRAEAVRRFVDIAEAPPSDSRSVVHKQDTFLPTHPVEIEMHAKMRQLFGRYAKMLGHTHGMKSRFKGRYFPHIFETITVEGDAGAARVAQKILGQWRAFGAGSPYLRERLSNREDFMRDVFFVMDAYINSATKAIYWKPVVDQVKGLTGKGGEFEKILAAKIAESGGKISEIRALKERMGKAQEWLMKHAEAGMGKRPSAIVDLADRTINSVLDRLGYKTKSPVRTFLRAYVYAQYVGGLGLSVGSSIKNLTQQLNTVSEVGPGWWGKAWKTIASDLADGKVGLNRILRRGHVFSASWTQDIQRAVGGSVLGRSSRNILRMGSDIALAPFAASEFLNRATAYLAGYYKAKSLGYNETRARAYGREIVSRTQFDYGPGVGGLAYTGPFAHALLQFTRFPIYQFDWLASVFRRAIPFGTPTTTMLPGEMRMAPAMRLALSSLVASPLMALLGIDFNSDFGVGGQPEVAKLAETKGLEALGRRGLLGGSKGYEGSVRGRKVARALGIEPYERTLQGALERAFGPVVPQGMDLLDMGIGDERQRYLARKQVYRDLLPLFPGLAFHRFQRFMQEASENQVRNSRTGEVMFPISDWDAAKRLVGINPTSVIDEYEALRDTKARYAADEQMRANLYDDVREYYKQLKDQKDPDAVAKSFARFSAGLVEIFTETGIEHEIHRPKNAINAFKQNVLGRIEEGERTTAIERIDRSRIMPRRR